MLVLERFRLNELGRIIRKLSSTTLVKNIKLLNLKVLPLGQRSGMRGILTARTIIHWTKAAVSTIKLKGSSKR